MSQRLEREIDEILAREAPDFSGPPHPIPFRRRRRFRLPPPPGWLGRLPSTSVLMLASIILAILVFFLNPRWPLLATVFAVIALALFIAGYVLAFRGPQAVGPDRRWRGQVVEYRRADEPEWLSRFRRWLRNR